MNTRPLLDRMAEKYTVGDGCWEWTAVVSTRGYGLIWNDGQMRAAHRVMYELMVGPIPDGLELDHLCRVRHCIRPDHLEPVTHQENMARGEGATKTHCKWGHEFTPENTYRWDGDPYRRCKTCAREQKQKRAETMWANVMEVGT